MQKASLEGWGLNDRDLSKLKATLGRDPEPSEIQEAAVQADFDYLKSWCDDEWRYVGLLVTLVKPDGTLDESPEGIIWGVPGNDLEHIRTVAFQIASELASEFSSELSEVAYWQSRDVVTV